MTIVSVSLNKDIIESLDKLKSLGFSGRSEIIRAGMNKAIGLQKIASHYNIPQDRIIAFGDEDNDLEMLQYAGHGVAMGNATDEVKNVANKKTKTNEEDGIAYYLKEVLSL